jgi:hypothetical protein
LRSVSNLAIHGTKSDQSWPPQLVTSLPKLRVRNPELELSHERKMHETALAPMLQEAETTRAAIRSHHSKVWCALYITGCRTQSVDAGRDDLVPYIFPLSPIPLHLSSNEPGLKASGCD